MGLGERSARPSQIKDKGMGGLKQQSFRERLIKSGARKREFLTFLYICASVRFGVPTSSIFSKGGAERNGIAPFKAPVKKGGESKLHGGGVIRLNLQRIKETEKTTPEAHLPDLDHGFERLTG